MTTTASGGVAAAAGLGFQYLATVDALLEHLETHEGDFELTTEDPRNEIIDFSLSIGGEVWLSVQAKASVDGPDGRSMTPSEIVATAVRLVEDPAERYEIRTNRPLTHHAATLVDAMRSIDHDWTAAEVRRIFVDAGAALPVLDHSHLLRLARLDVVSTGETDDEFAERITGRILALRRARSHGGGRDAARVLLRYLVAEVLHRSGRRTRRTLTRDAALELLGISQRSLAHCLGRYDSGNRVGAFPTLETVPRARLLDEVLGVLGPRTAGRSMRKVVLQGLSGTGKSSLAAAFCEVSATCDDHMLWIDASSELTITDQIARVLEEPVGEVTTEEVASMFRDLLAQSPDSWVIVFDNAPDAHVVSPWLPVRGHADVIVTSTNSAAWSTWRRVDVGVMAEDEAVDVIRLRLQLGSLTGEQHDDAVRLVTALDCWPLAVELACAFLVGSGRQLGFTDEYLRLLTGRVIDDPALVPAEYRSHPTLLQAVFVALDAVEARGRSASGLAAAALLDVLAYLPPRSAPIKLAGRVALVAAGRRAPPSGPLLEGDAVDLAIDDAVGHLAAASLVQPYDGLDLLGPRIRTNAVVLDLVRQLHDDEDRAVVLNLLQLGLSQKFFEALELEQYPFLVALVASSRHVIGHAVRCGAITNYGVALLGNLANFWMRRGEFERALDAFGEELALLDAASSTAYLIRAKIHAGILTSQLNLAAGSDDLVASMDLALSAAEQSISVEQRTSADLYEVGGQLMEVVHALKSSVIFTRGDRVDEWKRRILLVAPAADEHRARREVQEALRDPNNDDEASLRFYEAELATATGVHGRLDLLFARADTLVQLRRYEEAAEAFRHATSLSREHSLGLAPGWTSLLNAWRNSSFALLAGSELRAEIRHLGDVLDAAVGDDMPSARDDRAALALCRAVRVVEEAPLDVAAARVAALDRLVLDPTHLTVDTTLPRTAVRSCREILDLRERLGGAPVVRLREWGRGSVPVLGLPLFILTVDSACAVPAPPQPGRWVVAGHGVGLLIAGSTPTVVWTTTRDTGWLDLDGTSDSHGSRRLHALVSEYVSNPGAAWALVTAKAVADVAEEDVAAGPLVAVSGRAIEL